MAYTVYGMSESGNCYKIKLLLAQLKLDYHWIEIDIFNGETRSDEFLKMNPVGEVPVLDLGEGNFLSQSNAILAYLAQNTAFDPADRLSHARVLEWIFFEQYSHEPYIAVARAITKFYPADSKRREELPVLLKRGYATLDIMEQHLLKNDYLAGNKYSIADIALYAYTHVASEGGFDLSAYTHINRWLDKVCSQPGHVKIR